MEVVIKTTDLINKSIRLNPEVDPNDISDGYHTFGELYKHRIHNFIAVCRLEALLCKYSNQEHDTYIVKSKKHDDGSEYEGWFIMQLHTHRSGQISYHLPMEYWDICYFAQTLDRANEWDGHTSDDVLDRLLKI